MTITYKPAVRLVPSVAAPGKWNVQRIGQSGNMSVDPNGHVSFNESDGNYEQFDREGVALTIRPGSDQHADAPLIILLPSEV